LIKPEIIFIDITLAKALKIVTEITVLNILVGSLKITCMYLSWKVFSDVFGLYAYIILVKIIGQSHILKTVSLSRTSLICELEGK
jgi:hypothetical protein